MQLTLYPQEFHRKYSVYCWFQHKERPPKNKWKKIFLAKCDFFDISFSETLVKLKIVLCLLKIRFCKKIPGRSVPWENVYLIVYQNYSLPAVYILLSNHFEASSEHAGPDHPQYQHWLHAWVLSVSPKPEIMAF